MRYLQLILIFFSIPLINGCERKSILVQYENGSRGGFLAGHFPYGKWITRNGKYKLTLFEDDTYSFCFRDKCDENIILWDNEPYEQSTGKPVLMVFFVTRAGRRYLEKHYDGPSNHERIKDITDIIWS